MNYKELLETINSLEIGQSKNIYRVDNTDLWIHRPEKLGTSLKNKENYDVKTNFQIFMRGGDGKAFKPNHLRILLDLHLKLISNPEDAEQLFLILENKALTPASINRTKNKTHARIPNTPVVAVNVGIKPEP